MRQILRNYKSNFTKEGDKNQRTSNNGKNVAKAMQETQGERAMFHMW